MRRHLTIRTRIAVWCAALATLTGVLGVLITLAITDVRLRDAARAAPPPPGVAAPPPPARAADPADPAGRLLPPLLRGDAALATPAGRAAEGLRVQGILRGSRRIGVATVIALAAASVAASWLATRRMLRPVRLVSATAREVARPGAGRRIAADGPHDELRELGDTIDAMLDRLDASFESQRRFVADASHELKTPLAVLGAEIDVALGDPSRPAHELRDALHVVRHELDTLTHLVSSLLELARAETIVRNERHDLADAAEQAVAVVRRIDRGRHPIGVDLASAPVGGDPVLLDRLVLNLVQNAAAHNVDGGAIAVRTRSEGHRAVLVVENDGPPLDAAAIDGLTARFRRGASRQLGGEAGARATSKGTGQATGTPHDGHGLGLAIVQTIVTTHGGRLVLTPRAGGGLVAEVQLPRAPGTFG